MVVAACMHVVLVENLIVHLCNPKYIYGLTTPYLGYRKKGRKREKARELGSLLRERKRMECLN